MNLRQPYEQLIAGKLRHLPAPDADAAWQQMKRLLDEDEDRGGGGKRPPGKGSGWWRIGIMAVLLSAGLWVYVEKSAPDASLVKNSPATTENNTANSTNAATNNKRTVIDNTTTLNNSGSGSTSQKSGEAENAAEEKSGNNDAVKSNRETSADNKTVRIPSGRNNSIISGSSVSNGISKKENGSANKVNTADNNPDVDRSVIINQNALLNSTVKKKNAPGKNNTESGRAAGNNFTGTNTSVTRNEIDRQNDLAGNVNSENQLNSDQEKRANGQNKDNSKNTIAKNNIPTGENGIVFAGNQNTIRNFNLPAPIVSSKDRDFFGKLDALKIPADAVSPTNTSLAAGDSLQNDIDVTNLLSSDTKKQIAKAQRDNAIAIQDKKDKKGLHLNLSNLFQPFSLHVDPEPWWAAGLSLNAGMPVGAQSRFNYNMNGKSGSLTDYIPSPFLEFHLNNSVYLHTELNFITPQYTPQILAYRQTNDVTALAGVSQQKSIFIQKLYYFNWPISLHYSPVRNFYLSAGLQFSSFQSGLASVQQTQYTTAIGPDHPISFSNDILKFKDDSIAAKLPPNEWRWQAGAEYYWNRFTIGVRYNQSFKNLMTIPATSTVPETTIRNNAALFYIRYNLFESKNKADKERDREPTRY